jgi:RNA polymerase sigma factor (TIGR02999 family)
LDTPIPNSGDFTRLLIDWRQGDKGALDQLTPLIYTELRRLAGSYMRRERADHTLQATALVNEAYMRLAGVQGVEWKDRAHFVGIAARIMRQILLQHARSHNANKRGGDQRKVALDEVMVGTDEAARDIIALHDALEALARLDERKSRILELRYFGGLTATEIAEVLDLSEATIGREMKFAYAWLHQAVSADSPPKDN